MSRASVVLNVVLVIVVAAMAWALHMRANDDNALSRRMSAGESGQMVPSASVVDAGTADRLAGQLARIDARLAVLERGQSGGASAPAASPIAPEMPAAEADHRLGLLLPRRQIGRQELTEFHISLAALPSAEQFALSTALSRAINEGRIRLRP